MTVADQMRGLLAERQSGYSLPRALYVDPAEHDFDFEAIFARQWLQVGLEIEIPKPGDYLTVTIGTSSIVVVRNQEGGIGALFNTCRHRGAQICREERGHVHRLVCPYHQWTYDLHGKLLQAGRMQEGFEGSAIQLHPVRIETVAGLIYVCLGESPPDFTAFRAALEPLLEPHDLGNGKVAHTATLIEGAVSITTDGKPAVASKLGRVGDGDVGTMWWAAQPNCFNHAVGDYAFFFQALPTGPQETTVTAKWVVNKDAVEGVEYHLDRLIEVWDVTNNQDRALAENNQRGIRSMAYMPGPYSEIAEPKARQFVDWYCATSAAFVAARPDWRRGISDSERES